MKKLVVAMFAVALVTPMFAQAPAQTDQPKAEKTKKKAAKKKASKKKAEEPKAQ
jgi:Ni/Co efflux regulator RcnB